MARKKRKTKCKAKKRPLATIERRNPVAQAAILRKGGVHRRTRSGERQKQKKMLRKALADDGGSRQRQNEREGKQKDFITSIFKRYFEP